VMVMVTVMVVVMPAAAGVVQVRIKVVSAYSLVRTISPMPHKIQIMEHPHHNDRQGPHVDVVDRLALHMMKIAPALPPVFSGRHRGT